MSVYVYVSQPPRYGKDISNSAYEQTSSTKSQRDFYLQDVCFVFWRMMPTNRQARREYECKVNYENHHHSPKTMDQNINLYSYLVSQQNAEIFCKISLKCWGYFLKIPKQIVQQIINILSSFHILSRFQQIMQLKIC